MRMLRFRAASVAEAMAEVRREFGAEALILSTRRLGGMVEVAAAIESEPRPPRYAPPPLVPPARVRPAEALPEQARATEAAPAGGAPTGSGPTGGGPEPDRAHLLRWHGVPDAMAARLAAGPLVFALSLALRFSRLASVPSPDQPPVQPTIQPPAQPPGTQDRPSQGRPAVMAPGTAGARLLVIGPPGAGKTLTIVRLATRLVLAGMRPVVISTDTKRAGAHEQLAALTRVLGLAPLEAAEPMALARALGAVPPHLPVLIDSAGLDPFDTASGAETRALAGAAGAAPVAVLAAGGDPAEMADLAASLADFGASCLVATRLDLARRLGGVVAAGSHLALAELGVAPGIAHGLVAATPATLARRLGAPPPQAAARPSPRDRR